MTILETNEEDNESTITVNDTVIDFTSLNNKGNSLKAGRNSRTNYIKVMESTQFHQY